LGGKKGRQEVSPDNSYFSQACHTFAVLAGLTQRFFPQSYRDQSAFRRGCFLERIEPIIATACIAAISKPHLQNRLVRRLSCLFVLKIFLRVGFLVVL
jgi:hypothetical protein